MPKTSLIPRHRTGYVRVQNRAKIQPIYQGGLARGVDPMTRLRQVNSWRESLNPIAGLAMRKVRTLLEAAQRGEFADYQWTCKFIEERFPVLFGLVERRTAAILEMDWNIKVCSKTKSGFDQALADDQQSCLREAYERIDNLTESFEHVALATFRGFSHLQKHTNAAGDVIHLEPLDQWNFVRAGLYGPWYWNPNAESKGASGFTKNDTINPDEFIIRIVPRSVNSIGLVGYLYWGLGRKDQASFVEIFGIPGGVVIGPPGVSSDKEPAYQSSAESIAKGGSGYLPHGSDFKFSDSPRGSQPFKDLIDDVKADVVIAGTGGKLTMLTESGSGTLAGGAHTDTFKQIGKGEAKKVSELYQRDFDKEELEEEFPGKPRLAYFELAANEETDTGQVVEEVSKLSVAGYRVAPEEVSEKTGYEVELKPEVQPPDANTDPAAPGSSRTYNRRFIKNRQAALAATVPVIAVAATKISAAQMAVLQPVTDRLLGILELEDEQAGRAALAQFKADLPQILTTINKDPATAKVLEAAMTAGLFNGFATGAAQRTK